MRERSETHRVGENVPVTANSSYLEWMYRILEMSVSESNEEAVVAGTDQAMRREAGTQGLLTFMHCK